MIIFRLIFLAIYVLNFVCYLAISRFLSAFAKLPKATVSFVISVRPSVRPSAWSNSPPTGRILMKFDI